MLAAIAVAAGCGGGGGATPFVGASAAPSPHSGPTTVPVPNPSTTPEVVVLTGGGYTLTFTVPPITAGTAATMSAQLQTTLPAGVNLPQSKKASSRVPALPSTFQGLAYLTVSTSASIGFSSAPSFQFTVPSGAIPAGQNAYLLFWDPNVGPINGWINLLGPGTISGNTVTFAGVPTGVSLNANAQYVYALAVTTKSVPTASPAPTPTPLVAPAYCKTEGVAATNGVTINVTDSSNLPNSTLLIYVQQQSTHGLNPDPYDAGSWMDASGNFATSGAVPVPLPAACYSSTLGSGISNNPLVIPNGHAGRVYFVYIPKVPGSATTVPNPLPVNGTQPGSNAAYLYDKIEYGTTTSPIYPPVIDTTQVDFLGLPLEMQAVASTSATPLPAALPSACPMVVPQATPFAGPPSSSAATIVGVGQCGFAAIFQSLTTDPTFKTTYGPLASIQPWTAGNVSVDFRALSPLGAIEAGNSSFNVNLLADPTVTVPSGCNGSSPAWQQYGIIGCLLDSYKATPQVYTSSVAGTNGDGDYFCVSSDGNANFIATDIGTNSSCGSSPKPTNPTLPHNPFYIPAVLLANPSLPSPNPGAAPGVPACQYSQVFQASFGTAYVDEPNPPGPSPTPNLTGLAFGTWDAFALWKAMILEINYGSAFTSGIHPLESRPPSLAAGVFSSAISNFYGRAIHQHFDGNYAYAISYDDGFNWESGYTLTPPGAINVRVNPIPTASPAPPTGTPFPAPTCAAFQADVATYP